MRISGWTLAVLLAIVSAAKAQPGLPDYPTSTTEPINASKVEQRLKEHLEAWEKAMEKVENVRVDVKRACEDAVFRKSKVFTGSLLFKKPNLFIFRLESESDPTKQDYEAYLSNGKSLFQYSGTEKTITEYRLMTPTGKNVTEFRLSSPEAQVREWRRQIPDIDATDQYLERIARFLMRIPIGVMDKAMFFSGANPKDLQQRFEISLRKEDANYIYLNMKPINNKDKEDVRLISMALYGPKTNFPYFPAKIIRLLPNDDIETWTFTKPQTNIPGISEESFRYLNVPGFRVINAPAVPASETKTPDKTIPAIPESPAPEIPTAPTITPSVVEYPYTPSCCCERRFGWRLFRIFR